MTETEKTKVRLLSDDAPEFMTWTWEQIEPRYTALEAKEITPRSAESFLEDWGDVEAQASEIGYRLYVATTQDTSDAEAQARFQQYVTEIQPRLEAAQQRIREKVLASGIVPAGFESAIERMRSDAELFREENLPLQSEEATLGQQYLAVTGVQTVEWEGKTTSLAQLRTVLAESDRSRREAAWRASAQRRLQDRDTLAALWSQLLDLRVREAANAGFDSYIPYRWKLLQRVDYTPDDARTFQETIAAEVTPVVQRLMERRRERLGLEALRPWDLDVDTSGRPPLKPFDTADELVGGVKRIFNQLDPAFAGYIETMQTEGLLDVDGRLNKAPIGYMMPLPATRVPFIFFESTGQRIDVETMLHEGGHAAHVFATRDLPKLLGDMNQMPMEFVEVGSMAMEFLGEPYLTRDAGGFYTEEDAARARYDHIEARVLHSWCRIAMGDAFQFWVYEHPEEAKDAERCGEIWTELTQRYTPAVDWSGLEAEEAIGWMTVPHFFEAPFYYIEYGLAQLGAVQIAMNARRDERDAVRKYREALALGGSRSVPELFATAGGKFAVDRETFREAVRFLEETLDDLEGAAAAT